jgi:hypothetical protein
MIQRTTSFMPWKECPLIAAFQDASSQKQQNCDLFCLLELLGLRGRLYDSCGGIMMQFHKV